MLNSLKTCSIYSCLKSCWVLVTMKMSIFSQYERTEGQTDWSADTGLHKVIPIQPRPSRWGIANNNEALIDMTSFLAPDVCPQITFLLPSFSNQNVTVTTGSHFWDYVFVTAIKTVWLTEVQSCFQVYHQYSEEKVCIKFNKIKRYIH